MFTYCVCVGCGVMEGSGGGVGVNRVWGEYGGGSGVNMEWSGGE